jgi:hypothetical protein
VLALILELGLSEELGLTELEGEILELTDELGDCEELGE